MRKASALKYCNTIASWFPRKEPRGLLVKVSIPLTLYARLIRHVPDSVGRPENRQTRCGAMPASRAHSAMIFEVSLIAVMMLVLLMLAPGSGWTPNLALGMGPSSIRSVKVAMNAPARAVSPALQGLLSNYCVLRN